MNNLRWCNPFVWWTVFFSLLFAGTALITSSYFIISEIMPQYYLFLCLVQIAGCFAILKLNGYINLDSITVLFLLGTTYIFIRNIHNLDIYTLYPISSIVLFLICKTIDMRHLKNVGNILVLVTIIEAVYGLLQYADVLNNYSQFSILGTFDNPAGFASCISLGYPFCLASTEHKDWRRLTGILGIGLIIIAIILSYSRAGMLAVIIVSAIYFQHKFKLIKSYKEVCVYALILIGILIALFYLKKESALGRIGIWNVTFNLITDNLIFGTGAGGFSSQYMLYQADFFSNNKSGVFSILADNVIHPLNEYLFISAEYGIIGLLLFVSLLYVTLRSRMYKSPYLLCLISIAVLSFFTYPFRYPFIVCVGICSLAVMSRFKSPLFALKINFIWNLKVAITLILFVSLFFISKNLWFEYRWSRTAHSFTEADSDSLREEYKKLYIQWNGNPLFLYNYGAVLNYFGLYGESSEILHQCEDFYNDYDVQMLLADNYRQQDNMMDAEKHYKKASDMCPSRFMPLKRLLDIYIACGDLKQARQTATEIISKKIKYRTIEILLIIDDAENYLNEKNRRIDQRKPS